VLGAVGQDKTSARTARLPRFFDHLCDPVSMRMAYSCRAYPDAPQQQALARTFGCVRVVWNRTLAARQARYAAETASTSYAETDRALTVMKKDPALAFLNEVSCVPLQQALRHQHQAFTAFFAKRARGSSPGAAAKPPITPVAHSPCVMASFGWRRWLLLSASCGRGRRWT
jgi:hypothetical protein